MCFVLTIYLQCVPRVGQYTLTVREMHVWTAKSMRVSAVDNITYNINLYIYIHDGRSGSKQIDRIRRVVHTGGGRGSTPASLYV